MKKTGLVNFIFLVSFIMTISSFAAPALYAQSFVDCHGQLRVQGNRIVDAYGQAITLRGMSMYSWASQGLQYYNATAVSRLVNEWKCTVIRIPILPGNVGVQESQVRTVVDACIANGIYAIIDWHSMGGADAAACADFMKRMATAYGNTPNVMYETWNEPVTETWPNLKTYHQQVIAAIRAIDPDNIIFCGNTSWDQNPQQAANDPITTFTNIAYVVHFYAASHGQWLRDNVTAALNKGVAIFATEYGTGTADGNGSLDTGATQAWWNFMDANGIGCANWSVSALDEESAAFKTGTSATTWTDADLKPSGAFVKNYIITSNTPLWGACSSLPTNTRTATFTTTRTPSAPTITPTFTAVPTLAVVQAECRQGTVFTIDGNLNEPAWALGTWTSVTRVIEGAAGAVSARYKLKWDAAALYVGVDVTDPALCNTGANWYQDDAVEIYIDANHNQSAAYAADDYQFSIRYGDPVVREENNKVGLTQAFTHVTTGGYSAEFKIYWSDLGKTPLGGFTIGFDMGIDHNETCGAARNGVLVWNGTANNWQDTSAFGDAIMQVCAAASPTYTPTQTPTSTLIFTRTNTCSPSATITRSPVNTASNTPVNTATKTPSGTLTQTGTPASTATADFTFTQTLTSTHIFTPTITLTRTASPAITETVTGTTIAPSVTPAVTETASKVPASTFSPTMTHTATDTPAATTPSPTNIITPTVAIGGKFEIQNPLVFPNPCNPAISGLSISINLTKPADKLVVRIYTVAFRKIMEIQEDGDFLSHYVITVPSRKFSVHAQGLYYAVVLGETMAGEKAISKPVELIILK